MHWRRTWQPTPVFLPGESQGWGSLVGCRLWGLTESDTTEVTQQQQQFLVPGASFCIPQNQVFRVHLDFYFNACCCFRARATQLGCPPGVWYVSILPAFELLGSSWDILVQPSLLWPPQLVFADAASLLKKLLFFFFRKKFLFYF